MPENLSFSFFKQQLAIGVVNKELAQFAIYEMFMFPKAQTHMTTQ